MSRKRLFCELGPWAYAISIRKQILQRKIKNIFSKEKFADSRQSEPLPVAVYNLRCNMIKRGPGIDPGLQRNKADNIRLAAAKINGIVVRPGETFSFWHLVGKTSRRNGFSEGRVLVNGRLVSGVGGGLCNLANSLHILFMHTPMTITELHHHSDALAPDPGGVRVPYSAGTSVNYNFLDLRFRNDSSQSVQICVRCEGDDLIAELFTTVPFPYSYRITEEGHHFRKEENGNYYRISKIYRETIDSESGETVARELKWDNHSKVMYDSSLIPTSLIET